MEQQHETDPTISHDASEVAPGARTDRRKLLTSLAGAAAAGVAVATIGRPGSVEAADGGNMIIGASNEGSSSTVLRRTAASANNIFTATDRTSGGIFGDISIFPAAVGGFGYGTREVRNGVYGWSNARVNDNVNSGIGVVAGTGSSARAALRLFGPGRDPNTDSFDHAAGEIVVDGADNVWLCVVGGTPGTWRKIGGPATAGSFHAIDPIRCYDSRLSSYSVNGPMTPNSSRVVACRDSHAASDGAVLAADVVPAGATAIAYSVAVTETTGPNFLAIAAGDGSKPATSSINFWTSGLSLANGLTGKLDASRQIKVFCGGGPGSTHFTIDVNGYYL
jgi:hypothetical protein